MNAECRDIHEWIERYLDRELAGGEEALLREHLATCSQCRGLHQPLLEMIRQVEQAPAPEVPAGLYQRILAQLPAVERAPAVEKVLPGRFAARLGWLTAAAAVLALALLWPGTQQVPQHGAGGGSATIAVRTEPIDPVAVACLATMPYATMPGTGGAMVALAGATLAQDQSRLPVEEPVRVAVCMAAPSTAEDRLPPPISDVIQVISNRAALRGGL